MSGTDLGQVFLDMVVHHAEEIGVELKGELHLVRGYAADRMLHLSKIKGQAGYQEALDAEVTNVLLVAGGQGITGADALDVRLRSLARGLLAMGALII